jgi:sialidase-1
MMIASDDEGATWSRPSDVTKEIKPDDAVTTASGPGIGIKLKAPAHAGRLVIPFNSQDKKKNFVNWVAYSDDGGRHWRRGGNVPQTDGRQLNEVQVAEARDGTLYLNSRRWKGDAFRKVSWSKDGERPGARPSMTRPCQTPPAKARCCASTKVRRLRSTSSIRPAKAARTARSASPPTAAARGRLRAKSSRGRSPTSSIAALKDGRIGVLYEPAGDTVIEFRAVDPPGR